MEPCGSLELCEQIERLQLFWEEVEKNIQQSPQNNLGNLIKLIKRLDFD